jgi:hypothetical protein
VVASSCPRPPAPTFRSIILLSLRSAIRRILDITTILFDDYIIMHGHVVVELAALI